MSKKIRTAILVLLISLYGYSLPTAMADDAKRPLTIVLYPWAPYTGEDLPNGGLGAEIISRALKSQGYEVALTMAPWARAFKGTENGSYDIIPGLWHKPERVEKFSYSLPLLENRLVVISHQNIKLEFASLKDLTGHTVGIARDYGYPEDFLSSDLFVRETANSLEQNLKKIIYGRIGITVGDELVARYTALSKFGDAHSIFRYSEAAIDIHQYHAGVSRQNPAYENITAALNKGLEELRDSGRFQKIMARHFRPLSDQMEDEQETCCS